MANEVDIRFTGAKELVRILRDYSAEVESQLAKEMEVIATAWQAEAQRRVPVESGLLRNSILSETGKDGSDGYFAAVGSNQEYAPHIEFGTKWIAGGAVAALGNSPEVTDDQAIKSWPAKDENATAGSREQMPFLRPAFMSIRDWVLKRLQGVLRMK